MKRINSFLVIFMFLIFSISGAKMDINPRMYTRTDIKIELSALCDKDNVVLKMEFVNLSKDTIKIPLFLFPSDDKIFFGDWFEITDNNDNLIDYNGVQTDIDYSSEKVDCLILKSKQKYVVSISCLGKYYNLMKGATYSINYLGPLGESNIVKFIIK